MSDKEGWVVAVVLFLTWAALVVIAARNNLASDRIEFLEQRVERLEMME